MRAPVSPLRAVVATVAAVALSLSAGCGSDSDDLAGAPPSAAASADDQPDLAGSDDAGSDDAGSDDAGSDDAGSDDAGSDDAGSDDADADTELIEIELVDGEPQDRIDPVIEVDEGSTVRIVASSDETAEIHVHGFDESLELEPGEPGELEFTADMAGRYEVEVEESGTLLFNLQVQ